MIRYKFTITILYLLMLGAGAPTFPLAEAGAPATQGHRAVADVKQTVAYNYSTDYSNTMPNTLMPLSLFRPVGARGRDRAPRAAPGPSPQGNVVVVVV